MIYKASRADTRSKVGKLFALSWRLKEHHKNMIITAKYKTQKNVNFQEFENLLNQLYTSKPPILNSDLILQHLDTFIDQQLANVLQKDDKLVLGKKRGSKNHSRYITLPVLRHKMEVINKMLNQPNAKKLLLSKIKNGELQEKLLSLNDDLKAFFEGDGDDFLKTLPKAVFRTKKGQGQSFIYNNQTSDIITNIDNLYALAREINGATGQIYGEGFERSLEAFNRMINTMSENETNKIVNEIFGSNSNFKTAGHDVVNRGTLKSDIYTIKDNSIFSTGSDLVKIDSFEPKQGKMDVKFYLPDKTGSKSDILRISAKSWFGIADEDFGETSLFNALMRSANLDYTLAYGLVVGHYNHHPSSEKFLWPEVEAHEFAKTCIFLDIVMGYSQKTGYADTIVIEDRKNSLRPIKVISIYQLLDKVSQRIVADGHNMKTSGITYKYDSIDLHNIEDPRAWITQLQTDMHKIKVSVSSAILNIT